MAQSSKSEYGWVDATPRESADILTAPMDALIGPVGPETRIIDIGCGNGYHAGRYARRGCKVVGVDMAPDGIEIARKAHPQARFEVVPANEAILKVLGEAPFDVAISTEVVEHVFDAHAWASACFDALKPGGRLVMSTPYHGYIKNMAISVLNKWDGHFHPLRTGGHIKFWSKATIARLLEFHGFENIRFIGAGRVPYLWKSMVVGADRIKGPKPQGRIEDLWREDQASNA